MRSPGADGNNGLHELAAHLSATSSAFGNLLLLGWLFNEGTTEKQLTADRK